MEEARGDVSSGPVALTTERGEFELNTPTGLVSVMMSLPLITHTCGDTWLGHSPRIAKSFPLSVGIEFRDAASAGNYQAPNGTDQVDPLNWWTVAYVGPREQGNFQDLPCMEAQQRNNGVECD